MAIRTSGAPHQSPAVLGTPSRRESAETKSRQGAEVASSADEFRAAKPRKKKAAVITPPEAGPVRTDDDRDPMKHLAFLASDEMRGRLGPGPEYDKASRYVEGLMQKYGLTSLNPSDAKSPYFQSFKIRQWMDAPALAYDPGADAGSLAAPPSALEWKFRDRLFEQGFYVQPDMSPELVAEIAEHAPAAKAEGFGKSEKPRTLSDLEAASFEAGMVQNVVGKLEGTGPHKDEVLVVMAHLDHVGVDRQGRVLNGADDNASGVATTLSAMAQLAELQKQGKLDRSVVFVFTAAEEQGLLGSSYYANNPLVPLEKTIGVVNTDMTGRWDDQRISVIDTTKGKPNFFSELVDAANSQMADPFDRINRDLKGLEGRQDGASLARKGVPQLMLFEGLSNPMGGGDLIPEYHRHDEEIGLILRDNDGRKPARMAELLVNVVQLATSR